MTLPPLKILLVITLPGASEGRYSGATSCIRVEDCDGLVSISKVSDNALGNDIEGSSK